MSRKIYYWKLRDAEIQLGERTLIMGILNVTPDSFSDGGSFNDPDRALARALELEEQGADMIDIGAESTRPGSARISADEEWQRLVPILKRLRDKLRIPLSLDTYKSEIAERALQYGIQIFNDPSGLTFDPGLAKVAANANAGLILNHMRGTPESWAKMPPMSDPIAIIAQELNATISRARLAGVDRTRIVVDPGLGFGKRKEQNSEILGKLSTLADDLDYPILVGASRKSFLPQQSEADIVFATAAAVAIAALNGAHIVRVHDVKQMQSVLLVADEIARMAAYTNPALEKAAAAAAVRPPKPRPQVRQEEERVRPMRPPLAKPAAVEPPPAPPESVEAPEPAAAAEVEAEVRPERPPFVKRDKPEPRKFEDRNRGKQDRGGWAPPPRRESSRDSRPSRDSRAPKPGDRFGGPKSDRPRWTPRPDRAGSDQPRSGPPRSDRPASDRPRSGPPRSDRPSFDRPRSGPPRSDRPGSDRPRSGPPRSDRPGSDRPKFDRGKPGDAKGGKPRPDSRPPGDGRPPRRPFRKRP